MSVVAGMGCVDAVALLDLDLGLSDSRAVMTMDVFFFLFRRFFPLLVGEASDFIFFLALLASPSPGDSPRLLVVCRGRTLVLGPGVA